MQINNHTSVAQRQPQARAVLLSIERMPARLRQDVLHVLPGHQGSDAGRTTDADELGADVSSGALWVSG